MAGALLLTACADKNAANEANFKVKKALRALGSLHNARRAMSGRGQEIPG